MVLKDDERPRRHLRPNKLPVDEISSRPTVKKQCYVVAARLFSLTYHWCPSTFL